MKEKFIDAMIDLESMGVSNNPALLQISAVQFDLFTCQTKSEFNVIIDLQSSIDAGLDITPSTIKFWMTDKSVTQEARHTVMQGGVSLSTALSMFTYWCKSNDIVYIHGNGAASDNIWLRSAYTATNLDAPFTFRDDMCYRTIRTLSKRLGWKETIEFAGVVHNGIDDAKYQVKCLKSMLLFLGIIKDNGAVNENC